MFSRIFKRRKEKCEHDFRQANHIYGDTVTYGVCCVKCGKFPTKNEEEN